MNELKKNHVSAIFLDRDGVINRDFGYVCRKEQLQLLAEVGMTLAEMKKYGFLLIVVSNQSGVARGYFTLSEVYGFNQQIQFALRDYQVAIDRFYICPHLTDGIIPEFSKICTCRKPGNDMVEQAIAHFSIDRQRSFFVGDKLSDVECAEKSSIAPLLVCTDGNVDKFPSSGKDSEIAILKNLAEAWKVIKKKSTQK